MNWRGWRARLEKVEELIGCTGLPRLTLITQYVDCRRDSEDELLNSPISDFTEAETGGKRFSRTEGESLEDFECRVLAEVPTDGPAGLASFWCRDEDPEPPATA
jgi:hypothetical protein